MRPHEDVPSFEVIRAATVLGEGPLWCDRRRALLWIDGSRPQLLCWRYGAAAADVWPLERPPAALAHCHDGRLLIIFRSRFGVVDEPGAPVHELAIGDLLLGDERFNDAGVDPAGRLWVGTIDRALQRPLGALRRIDAAGMKVMARGFVLSNGVGWSPDGRMMYFAETFGRRIHRFRFTSVTGCIEPTSLLASIDSPSKPDGLAVDAEGGIWCAIFGAGRVHRYLPDGRLERSLRLPASQLTSCAFGGPDLRTLYVTSATYGLSPEQAKREPLAGCLFAVSMPVAGRLPTPLASENVLARAAASLSTQVLNKRDEPRTPSHA
ncbi:MAG: SMP-30/gluconolactonase/LRE family protein [Pigmentiphaga sp.]